MFMAQSLRKFVIIFSLCLMLLVCFTFGACSNIKPFKDGPDKNDIVIGNGSLAVTKGDYVYFANGYQSYSDVGDKNKEGKVTYSALYRIKMDENGNPEKVDPKYDEDGNEIFDGSRALKNVDILASKVVGFDYVGIYIFGDYIYYASPNNGVDKDLQTETQYISFFKRKLNRSGKAELLYTTKTEGNDVTFNMLEFDGNVYLNVLDGTTLVVVKNGKNKKEVENVTSVAFAQYTTSTEVVTEFNKDIYYTRAVNSDKDTNINGNVLCKFNLSTMTNFDNIFSDDDFTLTLQMAGKTKLYYEKTQSGFDTTKLYSITGVQNKALLDEQDATKNQYSNYYLLPDQANKVLVNDGDSLDVIDRLNETTKTVYSGSATVIGIKGQFVYFTKSDGKIMRANYQTLQDAETLVEEKTYTDNKRCFSITDSHFYYISTDQTNSSKYLHEIDLLNDNTDYFVGVLEKADYDVETTEAE